MATNENGRAANRTAQSPPSRDAARAGPDELGRATRSDDPRCRSEAAPSVPVASQRRGPLPPSSIEVSSRRPLSCCRGLSSGRLFCDRPEREAGRLGC
jgi:hypothetical protein